ncbi:coil containing protein [Vibrio phage 1.242.O._10N.261.54.B2]|nr:coil containing protein [Vibrio phage 1.242.O._10N.261.54.B2]
MSCSDFPTIQTAKTFKLDAETQNEVVTSDNDRTSEASDGKTKKTLWGIENDATLQRENIDQLAEAQLQNIETTFTAQFAYKRIGNISLYVGDSLTETDKLNSYQYPDDSDEWYGPVQDQVFPITIPADPSSDNGWALVNALTPGSLQLYTDIVYKASGGNSAVENMVDGMPVAAPLNQVVMCENGSTFKRVSSDNGDESDFIAISEIHVDDFGAVGDGLVSRVTPLGQSIGGYEDIKNPSATDDRLKIKSCIDFANSSSVNVCYGNRGYALLTEDGSDAYMFRIETSQLGNRTVFTNDKAVGVGAGNVFATHQTNLVENIKITGFVFDDFEFAIRFNNTFGNEISDNVFKNCTVQLDTDDTAYPDNNNDNNLITRNRFLLTDYRKNPDYHENPTPEEVKSWGGTSFGLRFTSNPFDTKHVNMNGNRHNRVIDNRFEYAAYSGFEMAGPINEYNTVEGNYFYRNSGTGCEIDKGGTGNTIKYNTFEDTVATELEGGVAQAHIQLQRSGDNVPHDNSIIGNRFIDNIGDDYFMIKSQGSTENRFVDNKYTKDSPHMGGINIQSKIELVGLEGSLNTLIDDCVFSGLSLNRSDPSFPELDSIQVKGSVANSLTTTGTSTAYICNELSLSDTSFSDGLITLSVSPKVMNVFNTAVKNMSDIQIGTLTSLSSRRVTIRDLDISEMSDELTVRGEVVSIKGGEIRDGDSFASIKVQKAERVFIEQVTATNLTGTRLITIDNSPSDEAIAVVRENYADNAPEDVRIDASYTKQHVYNNSWQDFKEPI